MISYTLLGRIFLGIFLIGLGLLHVIFPGIRSLLLPDLMNLPDHLQWSRFVVAFLLISIGVLISIGKQITTLSLCIAVVFLLLFLFGHLPAYLSATGREGKLRYWVNLNKTLALSGGFFIMAAIVIRQHNSSQKKFSKFLLVLGRCFFAIMLFLFGLGHILSTAALSAMVPDYIPFAMFWTFLGGIILMGSALSFFINLKTKESAWVLAITLFIWLLSLHLYYAVRYPAWQEGEHFIGSLTCLAFCGTALLISQSSNYFPPKQNGFI